MKAVELNSYIKRYLEEDKTNTAIMLTGDWGSGKTYYIEKVLVPFLQREKKNHIPFLKSGKENRCVVISLYGLEELSDISKSIYMELRMKILDKDSEAASAGKLIAKTVAKGIAGRLGIDVNMSEEDLKKMYSSIDVSDKLLVFEDLERSNIEITKLLGYVNNLVERDGVKVLLVANENEILGKSSESFNFDFTKLFSENPKSDDVESNKKCIPEDVQKYLRIKEKTISDTISFESDYCEAIKNIVNIFNNEILKEIIVEDKDGIEKLASMVKGQCNKNYRTFIFATQKTVDIYEKLEGSFDKDFLKCIYFGIISFAAKIKAEEFPAWEGTEYLSTILGTNWDPLFRFCYDYIGWQKLDVTSIKDAEEAYHKMKLYDTHADRSDVDLQKIYSYHERTEKEVTTVLETIQERLKDPEDIGFYSYGKLAAYLVMLKHIIGFDYTQCKQYMVENLKGKGEDIDSDILFLPMYDFEAGEKEEFDNFVKELSDSMNIKSEHDNFSYNPDDIADLLNRVIKEKNKINGNHVFLSRFNIAQIVEMLFHASSKQISDFRDILFAIYRHANKAEFIETDIMAMRELLRLVQGRVDSQNHDMDKIQVKQLQWLCGNLNTFISQMS
ncbi:hypothetical protein D3Z58_03020 [Clostridiaceae bacterium]|nr:hypothetical protein [Clostridiaceae bacterium]